MAATDGNEYAVRFDADYPESPSRLLALLGAIFWIKVLLLLPHILILIVLGVLSSIAYYIGYWAVLITGRYPRSLFDFVAGVERWSMRTDSWMNGLTDRYPPFSLGKPDYPSRFDVDYPESSSRLLALLGVVFFKFVLLLPHMFVLYFLGIVLFAVVYIGYWVVLITGKYPGGMFDLVKGVQRWSYRSNAWLVGLTDRYPPFSLD